MAGEYSLDYSKSREFENRLRQFPGDAEKVSNEVLKNKGGKLMMQSIIGFMPISKRNKRHAKTSNPLKTDYFNLGMRTYARGGAANSKGSFGYLVFPDEGRGPGNPVEQRFFERGGERASDYIFTELVAALTTALNN